MKRAFTIVAVAAALIVWGQNTAFVHGFTHSVGCAGLSWNASNYDGTVTNTITVTIDGTVVYSDLNFGVSDVGSRTWTQTVPHTWSIVVNAPGTDFDHSPSGVQAPCSTTITSTTTSSVPTSSIATTTIPATSTTTGTPSTTGPPCVGCTPGTQLVPTTVPVTTLPYYDPTCDHYNDQPTVCVSTTSSSVSPVTTSPSVPAEPLDELPNTGAGVPFLLGIAAALFMVGCFVALITARRKP